MVVSATVAMVTIVVVAEGEREAMDVFVGGKWVEVVVEVAGAALVALVTWATLAVAVEDVMLGVREHVPFTFNS